MNEIGEHVWVIPEGYIPKESSGEGREMESHETVCLLNASDQTAHVEITIYFSDKEPIGPYRVEVGARRTLHLRFNDLKDPEPIPKGVDYASVIRSDVKVVAQHTRLDSRQGSLALLSAMPYSAS